MILYYVKIEDLWPTQVNGSPIVTYKRADSEPMLESIMRKEFARKNANLDLIIVTVVGADLIED